VWAVVEEEDVAKANLLFEIQVSEDLEAPGLDRAARLNDPWAHRSKRSDARGRGDEGERRYGRDRRASSPFADGPRCHVDPLATWYPLYTPPRQRVPETANSPDVWTCRTPQPVPAGSDDQAMWGLQVTNSALFHAGRLVSMLVRLRSNT
jgi:hypothetical protein